MKIVFDLTPIYDHLTGVERYNLNLTKEIIMHHFENEYILLFKNEIHKDFTDIVLFSNVRRIIIPSCNKLVFIQVKLLDVLKKIDADYYVFLSFTSPILFKKDKIINAIHDLTCWDCPESIPIKMKYYFRYTFRIAAKRSWKLLTVSKFSQERICRKYRLSEENVPIIYDGLTDIFRNASPDKPEIKDKYNLPDKYILSLSTIEPRKNLQLLIKTYKNMIESGIELPDLVLAGRKGWKLGEIVGNWNEQMMERIHFTGFIDDIDLPQLYKEAEFFVFPSKYEGFGLPIIEAMSQGTIVVSSDAAALPEVVGNAGILFKSDNEYELRKAIITAMDLTKQEKEQRIKDGIIICQRFVWFHEAEKLYSLMK